MNNINRSLVKTQAQKIIKGKMFYLFIITIVVTVLTGGVTSVYNFGSSFKEGLINGYNSGSSYDNSYGYYGDFDDFFERNFGDDSFDNNPFEDFEYRPSSADSATIIGAADSPTAIAVTGFSFARAVISDLISLLSVVAVIVFAPLSVTLAGMYVSLIRRNANERFNLGKEFGGIFKNTFNDTFAKKFVLNILLGVLTVALLWLFIIPGIIFMYSAYFSMQIMNDYPNLKPSEAIKLSKKMIKGNRTELFVLDLSFIGWYLLMVITFGIAGIYVIPYIETTKALYYENFRLRALAYGKITEDDFLSEQERMMKYSGFNMNNPYQQGYYTANDTTQQGYYAPNDTAQQYPQYQPYQAPQQGYVNNNGTFYTPDFSPIQQYPPYYNMSQPYQQQGSGGYYYAPQPPQNEQPVQPAEPPQYYTPPAEEISENTEADTDNNE